MSVRTDVHRPSAPEFDPEQYELVGVYDLDPEDGDRRVKAFIVRSLVDRGYRFPGTHGPGQCGHCGAHIRYAALMTHDATSTMIWVGQTCLDNRFHALTKNEFDRLRRNASLNRDRVRKVERIARLVNDHPLLAELTYPELLEDSSDFVYDVARRFRENGELSDRQIDAVERAILRDVEWRERRAQWDAERVAERANAEPAPTGKVEVVGEVLTVKLKDTQFGGMLKMMVKDDRGFRVWVTVPKALTPAPDKGDRVAFTVTLKPAVDDPTFAFGSRPTQARRL